MSTLSDVQALYGSVRDTWAKSQAHVVAHVVIVVVFVICGVTLPEFPVPRLNPRQISESEWFKLAKDTGLIYVSFVIPVVIVAAYAAVLRTAGQMLVTVLMATFPPSSRGNKYRLLTPAILEPLALLLKKSDFNLTDLVNKSGELVFKYQSKKNEIWEAYQQSLSNLTKNAQIYLGDFLVFLLIWIMLFTLLPQAPWIQTNHEQFWPVAVVISALAWFAWFRVSRAMAAWPSLYLMYVSTMLRADPDMGSMLDVPEKHRENIRRRLEELLQTERDRVNHEPSLRRFLCYQLDLLEESSEKTDTAPRRGLPFRTLYEKGRQFGVSWQEKEYLQDYSHWFSGYFPYLYYRIHGRLSQLARAMWQLARYMITGAP